MKRFIAPHQPLSFLLINFLVIHKLKWLEQTLTTSKEFSTEEMCNMRRVPEKVPFGFVLGIINLFSYEMVLEILVVYKQTHYHTVINAAFNSTEFMGLCRHISVLDPFKNAGGNFCPFYTT